MDCATLPDACYWWLGVELGLGLPPGTLYSGCCNPNIPSVWLLRPRDFPVQSPGVFLGAPASSGHRTPCSLNCVCWLPRLPSERQENPVCSVHTPTRMGKNMWKLVVPHGMRRAGAGIIGPSPCPRLLLSS